MPLQFSHRKVYKERTLTIYMTDETPTPTPTTPETNEPTSLYDKTNALVTRQEEANKKREEILEREETLHANQRLAGTTGGNVETKLVSPEDEKVNNAKEMFKDTALGDAIKKTNE